METEKALSSEMLSGAIELGARGKRLITENIGKAIAILTAVLAVLLTFLDVALPELSIRSITTEMLILLIAAYIIYFSLEDAGEDAGRRTEVYEISRKAYAEVRERIDGEMIAPLREFCLEYAKAELIYRRRLLLVSEAVCEEEYEGYRSGKEYDRKNEKLFKKLDAMKALSIDPRQLLEGECDSESGDFSNPKRKKPLRLLLRLLPLTLSTLFTVSLMITAKDGLDLAGVLEGIVKLGCLPIVALRGYAGGYAYSTESLTAWYNKRRDLLAAFLEWREKHKDQ